MFYRTIHGDLWRNTGCANSKCHILDIILSTIEKRRTLNEPYTDMCYNILINMSSITMLFFWFFKKQKAWHVFGQVLCCERCCSWFGCLVKNEKHSNYKWEAKVILDRTILFKFLRYPFISIGRPFYNNLLVCFWIMTYFWKCRNLFYDIFKKNVRNSFKIIS